LQDGGIVVVVSLSKAILSSLERITKELLDDFCVKLVVLVQTSDHFVDGIVCEVFFDVPNCSEVVIVVSFSSLFEVIDDIGIKLLIKCAELSELAHKISLMLFQGDPSSELRNAFVSEEINNVHFFHNSIFCKCSFLLFLFAVSGALVSFSARTAATATKELGEISIIVSLSLL
jgi:hypothetical protein